MAVNQGIASSSHGGTLLSMGSMKAANSFSTSNSGTMNNNLTASFYHSAKKNLRQGQSSGMGTSQMNS